MHEQQLTLKGQIKSEPHLDAVQHYPLPKGSLLQQGRRRKSVSQHQSPTRSSVQSQQQATCTRCGQGSQPRQQCPARDAECYKCYKQGHYGRLCRTKSVTEVLDPELLDNFACLNTGGFDQSTMWSVTISVNGRPPQFKVDAEATVV